MAVIEKMKDGLRSVGRSKRLLAGAHCKNPVFQNTYRNNQNISVKRCDVRRSSKSGSQYNYKAFNLDDDE